jgi:PAS domain S-box-containing protein
MEWSDPNIQTAIVGTVLNVAGAVMALYLWTQDRSERYLAFWSAAWCTGIVRWLIHFPAEGSAWLRSLEGIVLIPAILMFMLLGSYDLLPNKPWRSSRVVALTAAALLVYGLAAQYAEMPLGMGYALFAAILLVCAACMHFAYRSTRLSGYAFAAATFAYQFAFLTFGLLEVGAAVSNSILGPLYNLPLLLSLVVISYQRACRKLAESEHTLQKIFDTAPTPIVITRPPLGEIERANALAMEVLGLSAGSTLGLTSIEHGIAADVGTRRGVYDALAAGRAVRGTELRIERSGENRILLVNADRIDLEAGPRNIFSFFDVTDLRRAQAELEASSAEMRALYLRLGTVEEDERRGLHRELHDRVGANLSALRLELDLIRTLLLRGDVEQVQDHVSSAIEVAQESVIMTRDLMAELRPPALDDYGLVAALRSHAESLSRRLDVPIEVTGRDLSPRLAPFVETMLFRIAQEALNNALKHAAPERVRIEISEAAGRVLMTIQDDGLGFDTSQSLDGEHWGVKHMRERARAIGGCLSISSSQGAGTVVRIELASPTPCR